MNIENKNYAILTTDVLASATAASLASAIFWYSLYIDSRCIDDRWLISGEVEYECTVLPREIATPHRQTAFAGSVTLILKKFQMGLLHLLLELDAILRALIQNEAECDVTSNSKQSSTE